MALMQHDTSSSDEAKAYRRSLIKAIIKRFGNPDRLPDEELYARFRATMITDDSLQMVEVGVRQEPLMWIHGTWKDIAQFLGEK